MSVKHRYSRTLAPGDVQRGPTERFVRGTFPGRKSEGGEEDCTCWVLLRGEGSQPLSRETADCELVPDPGCPAHGRKRFPILDDEDWGD